MISRRLIPIGTSMSPGLTTFPPTANVLVPLDFSVPIRAYQAAPFKMICGTFAYVSTLLLLLGLPQTPFTEGKGGRGCGSPRPPMIEEINAVSSPQTNAPAPTRTSRSNEKSLPRMFLPRSPNSRAWAIAMFNVSTAIDVAVACPDRIGADDHALDHGVRVALQHAAVHERTGITLVGVADHVLGCIRHGARDRPLLAGRKTRASPSTQAGGKHFLDD